MSSGQAFIRNERVPRFRNLRHVTAKEKCSCREHQSPPPRSSHLDFRFHLARYEARLARSRSAARAAAAPSPGPVKDADGKIRIVLAVHERLIVTYTASDHVVYVLTPPGEDPRAVLRAARLVLPEDTYADLASHLVETLSSRAGRAPR